MDDTAARLRTAVARTERLLARHGDETLTRTQFSVLGAVARQGALRSAELATREGLNPTLLSRVLGSLETGGLISRHPHPHDGRQVLVEATAAGVAAHAERQQRRTEQLEHALAALTDRQQKTLRNALPALEALVEHLRDDRLVSA